MTSTPSTPFDPSAAGLAADSRALESLKARARSDPKATAHAAAQRFEALFLQSLLSQMRQALPGTDELSSSAVKMQTSLYDQHIAEKLAQRGTGLADAIAKQIERQLPKPKDATGTEAQAPAAQKAAIASPSPARRVTDAPSPHAKLDATISAPVRKVVAAPQLPESAATGIAQGHKESFVERMIAHAQDAAKSLGVPASFVVGQAALESGWGRHEIKAPDGSQSFNLFGIKAGLGWAGKTVDAVTTEVAGGVARRVVQKFRAYGSYAEAFADYAKLIGTSPRYSNAAVGATDAHSYAAALAKGGYATDPSYTSKLSSVIASVGATVEKLVSRTIA